MLFLQRGSGIHVVRIAAEQELPDYGGDLLGAGEQAEVAVGVDVQPGGRQERGHHLGVDQRDDRVVVAGQDQRRLADERKERQAGPADARRELGRSGVDAARW